MAAWLPEEKVHTVVDTWPSLSQIEMYTVKNLKDLLREKGGTLGGNKDTLKTRVLELRSTALKKQRTSRPVDKHSEAGDSSLLPFNLENDAEESGMEMEKLIAAKVNRDVSDAEESEMEKFQSGSRSHGGVLKSAEFSSQAVAEYQEERSSQVSGVPQHLADKAAFMAEFSSQEVAAYQVELEEWEAEMENAALAASFRDHEKREDLEAQFDPATSQFACDNPGRVERATSNGAIASIHHQVRGFLD